MKIKNIYELKHNDLIMNNCINFFKEKYLKRADIVWRNGTNNISDVRFLFKLCDLALKYEIAKEITNSIKKEIWERRSEKDVWSYIGVKELEVCEYLSNLLFKYLKILKLIFYLFSGLSLVRN